jgi:aldehyde:ferredoxin oxidoreductase
MEIVRIDCRNLTYKYEPLPGIFQTSGGRGIIAHVLSEEVDARCNPLGRENKLIVCNGPLAGANISSAGRLSIGAKSPLTGGIKESNAGGTAGEALAGLGLRAIIFEDQGADIPAAGGRGKAPLYLLKLDPGEAEFIPADEYAGLGNYEMKKRLAERFGENYSTLTIGPAGEKQFINSGIAVSDRDGRPSRLAARGGLGAVMGGKGIKAVLIRMKGGYKYEGAGSEAFKKAGSTYHEVVKTNDRIKVLREYGTASTVMDAQRLGALPTRNFSSGQFDGVETLTGEFIHDEIERRGGEGTNSESCMQICLIQCSNVYPDRKGKEIVAPFEYETISLLGSNIEVGNTDTVAYLNYLCNDYGMDTIETGGALGVMAAAGMLTFGDDQCFIDAVREVPKNGSWTGRLIGMGTENAARILGVWRAPVVKGQCMSGYDPRGVKGTGITYATTPMGADHTAGLTVFAPVDHHSKEGQIDLSRKIQIGRAAYDVFGLCAFLMAATAMKPELVTDMLNGLYGTDFDPSYVAETGKDVIRRELAFNRAAGFTDADDTIPDFFKQEKLPPFNLVWDITDEELSSLFGDLK